MVPLKQIHRIHASSGTTGKSTIVGYTKNDLDTWSELTCRSLQVGGAKQGDCIQISYGYSHMKFVYNRLALLLLPVKNDRSAPTRYLDHFWCNQQ